MDWSWLVLLEADQQQLPSGIQGAFHVKFPVSGDRLVDILPNRGVDLGWHRLVEVARPEAGDNIDDRLLVQAKAFGPVGRGPDNAARTNGSAKPAAEAIHPGLSRRSRSSANPAANNHPAAVRVNRDASLFCVWPGSAGSAPRARAVPDGWPGNARQPPAGCADGRAARSLRRSRSGHGRKSYRSGPGPGIRHRGTGAPRWHPDRIDESGLDFRRVWRDIAPACVPGTV